MRAFLLHLRWLREQSADHALAEIPDQKLRQFAAEARSLNAADLSRMTEAKRLTLIAALLRRRAAAALDEAAEMFVRLTMATTAISSCRGKSIIATSPLCRAGRPFGRPRNVRRRPEGQARSSD